MQSRGIKEAAGLFEKFSAEKAEREAAEMPKMRNRQRGVKPPLYTKIKTNRPFGDCPIFTESEVGLLRPLTCCFGQQQQILDNYRVTHQVVPLVLSWS